MKKIIYLFSLMLITTVSYSQVKVVTSGWTKVGNTSVSPLSNLHIDSPTAQTNLRLSTQGSALSYTEFRDWGGISQINKYHNGHVNLDINPRPDNGFVGKFRFFRATNTTGQVAFEVYKGDGTGTINNFIAGNAGTHMSVIPGNNFVVGSISNPNAAYKFQVNGDAYKNSGGDNWNMPSDKRLKNNIKAFKKGLNIIMALDPVSYTYNGKAGTIAGENSIGVLAQDLQEIAPFMVSEATFIENIKDENEVKSVREEKFLSVNASALKWIMVNAIQDQQEQIEEKDARLIELENKVESLTKLIDEILSNEDNTSATVNLENQEIGLDQNKPNPFNDNTTISYVVPNETKNATIKVFDVTGILLKSIPVEGKGELKLNASDLSSGTYIYQLHLDNKLVNSKKMIISK